MFFRWATYINVGAISEYTGIINNVISISEISSRNSEAVASEFQEDIG